MTPPRRSRVGQGVVRSGLTEQVYDALKAAIINDEFVAGERLVIDQLAQRLHVSATPVREALARLAGQDLVSVETYVGYTIAAPPTIDELVQMFEAREALEGFAARLACKRMDAVDIDALEAINERIVSRSYGGARYDDFADFISDNQEFHELLIAGAKNQSLQKAFAALNYDTRIALVTRGRGIPDLAKIHEDHKGIVDALRRHSAPAAEKAVLAHIRDGSRRLLSELSTGDGSGTVSQ
jgi:DNA-binding GntR family transcriptional regulator